MARVALLDGDGFAYRCAAAVEKTLYSVGPQVYATHKEAVAASSELGLEIWSRKTVGTLKEATDTLEASLERSIASARAGVFHVYLGGDGPTFRDHLARIKKYKGNRDGVARPVYLHDLRNYIVRYWGGVVSSGEEADDVLAYTATELREQNDTIIVGYDKDLDQIPGEHYDWVNKASYTVTDAEARSRLWMQVLSGDVADNIGGCYKVGPSNAKRIVDECISLGWDDAVMWRLVCAAYEESQEKAGCPYVKYDPVEVALENYNLVRLRQSRHEKHEYKGLFPTEKNDQNNTEAGTSTGETETKAEVTDEVSLEVGRNDNRRLGHEGDRV